MFFLFCLRVLLYITLAVFHVLLPCFGEMEIHILLSLTALDKTQETFYQRDKAQSVCERYRRTLTLSLTLTLSHHQADSSLSEHLEQTVGPTGI